MGPSPAVFGPVRTAAPRRLRLGNPRSIASRARLRPRTATQPSGSARAAGVRPEASRKRIAKEPARRPSSTAPDLARNDASDVRERAHDPVMMGVRERHAGDWQRWTERTQGANSRCSNFDYLIQKVASRLSRLQWLTLEVATAASIIAQAVKRLYANFPNLLVDQFAVSTSAILDRRAPPLSPLESSVGDEQKRLATPITNR